MTQCETNSEPYVPVERADEDVWIREATHGDKDAFSQLYHRYYGQIHAFCMRMLHGRPDVEDAVQQVFLEAWRSLCRFERRSLFSTWLTKIAIHTCLSFHRKNSRILLSNTEHSNIADDADDVVWKTEITLPDEHVYKSARKRAISKILGRMTIKKQVVFVLSDMQGMTAPEISKILGIPDATVRTRLFHARREFLSSIHKNAVYRDLFQEVRNLEKTQKSA